MKILISRDRIDSGNELARHKTDRRGFFDERLNNARARGFDEIVFRNERGELAEGSISNLLLRKEGIWKTPPLSCGLLPGIQREKALRELHALECVLTLDDLRNADEVRIGNSVRGSGRVVSAVLEETGEELRGAAVRDEGA